MLGVGCGGEPEATGPTSDEGPSAPVEAPTPPLEPSEPDPAAVPEPATPCAEIPVFRDGAPDGTVCASHAAADGLTVIDLSDDWTPRVFEEDAALGELGVQPYRPVYLALADERWDALPEDVEAERFLELFGIQPTFRVLLSRLTDVERHACHAAIDDAPLERFTVALRPWSIPGNEQRRDVRAMRYLDGALERDRERLGLPDMAALEASGERAQSVTQWRRLHLRIDAIGVVQAHLRCDGLLEASDEGVFDARVGNALAAYQREHVVVSAGTLDAATRARLSEDSREADFLAALRTLRERVVAATGLVEDGSASHAWGTVLGRDLDPPEMRFEAGREALENGAPDLVSAATEAAATALGWTSADGLVAFFAGDVPRQVAVPLPPLPDYHGEHIEMRAEVDRGDLWFEYPYSNAGVRRPQAVERRPTVTLYATAPDGHEVALVRWPTTIGGWKPERSGGGAIGLRYKESPAGPRLWRDVIAAPAWLPPPSTPDDELVRRMPGGRFAPHLTLFGPSHRSAYGLAMVMHHRVITARDGTTTLFDEGVRVHGSVSYRSITSGTSHGCHRLYNHLAVRLMGFLLDHRRHERRGSIPTLYGRRVAIGGQVVDIRLRSRGYLYVLTPPVEVNVLDGNVLGNVAEAPSGFRPLPEALAAAAAEAAAAEEGM